MSEMLDSPIFGIIISIAAYEIGLFVNRKTKIAVFNPLLISIILVVSFLSGFNIKLDSYNKGGSIISIFLAPATVILAVPLYKQLETLKRNFWNIIIGITTGCVTSILSVIILVKIFRLDDKLGLSLVPKSITTPVGMEVSKQIGGIPSITVAVIILTGIFGAVIAPWICKLFRIEDRVAVGIAIGTSSHAVGTTKALEMGELEGAMSGLSIGLAALITVFIAPIMIKFIF